MLFLYVRQLSEEQEEPLTPDVPIVEVHGRTIWIIHVTVIFLAVDGRRVPLAFAARFNLFNSYISFWCLFAVGLSRDSGYAPNFFQEFAENHFRRDSNIFVRIRKVFAGERVR